MQNIQKQRKRSASYLSRIRSCVPLDATNATSAYEGEKVGTTDTSAPDIQQQVFTAYILQMFKRRPSDVHYSPQQTIRYLQWLARQLQQHNKEPSILNLCSLIGYMNIHFSQRLYPAFAVALIYGLLSSLATVLVTCLTFHSHK